MITLASGDTIQGQAGTASAVTYTLFGMELSSSGVETYSKLAQGQLGTGAGVMYTAPAATSSFIKQIVLCNTSSSPVNGINIFAGGNAAGNQLYQFNLQGNGFVVIDDSGVHAYDSSGNLLYQGAQFDSTAPSSCTPGVPSASGSAGTAARRDHTHSACGGIASITANVGPITTAETQIIAATIPANSMNAGTMFRLTILGICTSSAANTQHFRVRFGTTGINSDTAVVDFALAAAASGTNVVFEIVAWVTVRTTGSSGTVQAAMMAQNSSATGIAASYMPGYYNASTPNVDTTQAEILQFTYASGGSTTSVTIQQALIEVVKV